MKSPIRFGMVGAGGIAQTYAQVFQVLDEVKLAAVVGFQGRIGRPLFHALDGAWIERELPAPGQLSELKVSDAIVRLEPQGFLQMVACLVIALQLGQDGARIFVRDGRARLGQVAPVL